MEEKEGFWLKVRTYIFQLVILLGIIMIIGLIPSPANVWITMLIIALMLSWKKLIKKNKKEKGE